MNLNQMIEALGDLRTQSRGHTRIRFTNNCVLDVKVTDSGIKGMKTLSIYRQFPLAQHPRWQLAFQATGDVGLLRSIADIIDYELED